MSCFNYLCSLSLLRSAGSLCARCSRGWLDQEPPGHVPVPPVPPGRAQVPPALQSKWEQAPIAVESPALSVIKASLIFTSLVC